MNTVYVDEESLIPEWVEQVKMLISQAEDIAEKMYVPFDGMNLSQTHLNFMYRDLEVLRHKFEQIEIKVGSDE